MPGQVNLGTPMGDALYELARRAEVETCLEIGTWNGEGSTFCIAKGLAETGGRLHSIELNPAFYERAVRFYAGEGQLPVELIRGLALSVDDYKGFDAYAEAISRTADADYEAYRRWYEEELQLARVAEQKLVLRSLLERESWFDLVLLDGGEFTGYAEFKYLEPHMRRYVVLDDTNPRHSIKNAQVRDEILVDTAWEVTVDAIDDRGGWLVARRSCQAPQARSQGGRA